jgi:thiol-disulfide isomerase/thioredoxin
LASLAVIVFAQSWSVGYAAQQPKAEDALRLTPIQKGVDYDRPTPEEAAKCKISIVKGSGQSGWIVTDPQGSTLRRFLDTNGDNVVDQWSYFKDGIEVYRDIDGDFNGKADQYRWFNTAGTRWGIDKQERGVIDVWKAISAEEASAEAVVAVNAQDGARFARLVLRESEVARLGLSQDKADQLLTRVRRIPDDLDKLFSEQKAAAGSMKWVQFSAGAPGTVPAGTDGSTSDVQAYENAVALIEMNGKHGQLQIGTLVRVGDAWRLIDVPHLIGEGQSPPAPMSFFFRPAAGLQAKQMGTQGAEGQQKFFAALEELDAKAASLTTAEQRADYNARRADLVERLADQTRDAEERDMWFRQLADMIAAAVQSGAYPDGVKRLESLFEKLQKSNSERDQALAAHVKFWQVRLEFDQKMQQPKADFSQIQADRRKALEQYVSDYPKGIDAAEAMLQLAIEREWAGQEDEAKKWYQRITSEYADAPVAKKAAGALTRLDSVGQPIAFRGKTPSGDAVDLARYKGSVVLIQFWATWCEPCKADMAVLKELTSKYGSTLKVIGVNLDSKSADLNAFLSENRLPWPQIYEEGGLDSPPANQLGIVTVPTVILVDRSGKVVSRNVRTAELETEVKKLLR